LVQIFDQRYKTNQIQAGTLDLQYTHDAAGRVTGVSGNLHLCLGYAQQPVEKHETIATEPLQIEHLREQFSICSAVKADENLFSTAVTLKRIK
jgi:hypothetical protein